VCRAVFNVVFSAASWSDIEKHTDRGNTYIESGRSDVIRNFQRPKVTTIEIFQSKTSFTDELNQLHYVRNAGAWPVSYGLPPIHK